MDSWLMGDSEVARFYQRNLEWNRIAGNDPKDPAMRKLYYDLVQEEKRELLEAYNNRDAREFCKELADCLVVTSYLTFCVGDETEGQLCDPSKVANTCQSSEICIDHVLKDYGTASELLGELESLGLSLDVDFARILHKVMDSNFSKFISVSDLVNYDAGYAAGICNDIENRSAGRYTGVTSQESNGYIVFRDDKGKILKPPCYFEADISDCIPKKWLK